jgi:HSP20 family protein
MTRNPFEWFRREFAPLFDRAFSAMPFEETPWEPYRVFETEERENEYVVRVMVPGFEASELEVTLAGNVLTLRAEHRPAENEPAVERPHARLEQTLTLPPGVNLEAVEARVHNGILEVHIPRIPALQPRRIEVKA